MVYIMICCKENIENALTGTADTCKRFQRAAGWCEAARDVERITLEQTGEKLKTFAFGLTVE